MDVVTVTCDCNTDPKTVHITLSLGGIVYRTLDIPSPLYDAMAEALLWPSNPCANCP